MSDAIAITAYALAAGLTRDEASKLHAWLLPREYPLSVDQAWEQLHQATIMIRKERQHD